MKRALLFLLKMYKRYISPGLPQNRCKYLPTCWNTHMVRLKSTGCCVEVCLPSGGSSAAIRFQKAGMIPSHKQGQLAAFYFSHTSIWGMPPSGMQASKYGCAQETLITTRFA